MHLLPPNLLDRLAGVLPDPLRAEALIGFRALELSAAGSVLGLVIGRRKEAAVAGALIGAAVGAISVALSQAGRVELPGETGGV